MAMTHPPIFVNFTQDIIELFPNRIKKKTFKKIPGYDLENVTFITLDKDTRTEHFCQRTAVNLSTFEL